jgi:predicted PurR-regulated permease PerM
MAISDALFYQRVLAVGGIAIVAMLLYLVLEPFLGPIAWAVFLGFLLQPAHARLTRRLRGSESVSALALTILVLVLILGPLTALALAFARQAADLAALLQVWVGQQQRRSFSGLSEMPVIGDALAWLDENVQISTAHVQAWLVDGSKHLFEQLASLGGTAFLGAVGTVLAFTVMLFLLFFFIRDGRAIARGSVGLVPLTPERREELAGRLASVTRAVVRGTILTALIQGFLLGIGFAVVGLPAPVVFGVLAAILSVVPIGGTALVWAPAVIMLMFQGAYIRAGILLAFGVVVSTVDNFLKPFLIAGRAVLPTIGVFIGVLGGLAAFGVIGLFMGPIVIALALTLISFARESKSR